MNIRKYKVFSAIITFLVTIYFSNNGVASTTVPTYTAGGALSSLSAQSALDPMTNTQGVSWWYFTSMLTDQNNQPHSLQINIFKMPFFTGAFGAAAIGFSFKNKDDQSLYMWTNYGNAKMLSHFPAGQLTSTKAGTGLFKIQVTPFFNNQHGLSPNFFFNFSHNPDDHSHIAGELGASYILIASGYAQVGMSQHHPETVQYQFHANMTDTRGLMPEGYGGFVGAVLGQPTPTVGNKSWELTMPKLTLKNWTMTITPVSTVTSQSPLQHTVQFTNKNGASANDIWMDRQILYPIKSSSTAMRNNTFSQMKEIALAEKNGAKVPEIVSSQTKELYHGTWMSFCFNKKTYHGFCGDITAFWQPDATTSQMDSDQNAFGGFANLFLPSVHEKNHPIASGGSVNESLYFSKTHHATPYRIVNDASSVFQSQISGNHYAKTVYVTLRKNTPINAMLNMHSNKNAKAITLKFEALSTKTEDIFLTDNEAFFEGAATVSVCHADHQHCRPIGTGFVEQMGYHA